MLKKEYEQRLSARQLTPIISYNVSLLFLSCFTDKETKTLVNNTFYHPHS